MNTYGDVDTYKSEGVIEFTLEGRRLTLRPFTTRPNRFYIVFRDASSGSETYEAARFLYADLLEDGTTVLDFNEAYNPPCAFNPYTTCPIPIPENRLPVKVLAGEKAYPVHVDLPMKTPPDINVSHSDRPDIPVRRPLTVLSADPSASCRQARISPTDRPVCA